MSYPRGYKIFEPLDPLNPNTSVDHLVATLTEGVDYLTNDANISFIETLSNSTYLNGGVTEFRYFAPFDDENTGNPSSVFSLLNLMPPSNIVMSSQEYDTITITFTNADYASTYRYTLLNIDSRALQQGSINNGESITAGIYANTRYELKIASMNNLGESTEWSNAVTLTTKTMFRLLKQLSSRHISFTIEHGGETTKTPTKFEIINRLNSNILHTGLELAVDVDSPTSKYDTIARVTYDDLSTRDTRNLVFDAYDDGAVDGYLNQNIQIDSYLRSAMINDFPTDLKKQFVETQNFTRTIFDKTYLAQRICKDGGLFGANKISLFNNRKDDLQFRQDSFVSNKFNFSSDAIYVRDNIILSTFNYNVYNSLAVEKGCITNDFRLDKKNTTGIRLGIRTGVTKNVPSKYTIVADDKIITLYNLNIKNNRTTQYGLKLPLHNDRKTPTARVGQLFYNPTKPFDIDSRDIIFNATITNIDIKSEINKLRILCVGDSITAGAPAYDPMYGGTVWMSDLITGKTKTRNVIESSYPYWLQVRLGISDFEVINEGSGRRTSSDVEYHIKQQMETYKPEFVIIMIGTNDIFSAQDSGAKNLSNVVSTTLSNIRKTVDTVIANGGQPIIGTQLPRNSIVPLEAKDALRTLNAGIKNLGIEYALDIIDWYSVFVQKDNNGKETGVLRYDLTVDDTHPSIQGYKNMAYTINLGIFNSFRANIRLFNNLNAKGDDVDYQTEESKTQPDPYTLNYKITFPELRRLQRYVFSKYIKNTGNSTGLFTIQLSEVEDICEIWDFKKKEWVNYMTGMLAPDQIMELRMRYTMPAIGTTKEVDFTVDYIVKR